MIQPFFKLKKEVLLSSYSYSPPPKHQKTLGAASKEHCHLKRSGQRTGATERLRFTFKQLFSLIPLKHSPYNRKSCFPKKFKNSIFFYHLMLEFAFVRTILDLHRNTPNWDMIITSVQATQ